MRTVQKRHRRVDRGVVPIFTCVGIAAIAGSLLVLGLPWFEGVASGASPVITSPSVAPSSAPVGTPLTFTWTVTSSAPLSSTAIYLIDPSGHIYLECPSATQKSGTSTDGDYQMVCELPNGVVAGQWTSEIIAQDNLNEDVSQTGPNFTVTGSTASAPTPVCTPAGTCTVDLSYVGAGQNWTAPAGVSQISLTLRGAAGGDSGAPGYTHQPGGSGAQVMVVLPVTPGSTYQVDVGGAGPGNGNETGGFNGGGSAIGSEPSLFGGNQLSSGGGGGATDFRQSPYGLSDRLVVAGGGGGAGGGGSVVTTLGGPGGNSDGGATGGEADGVAGSGGGGGGGSSGTETQGGAGGAAGAANGGSPGVAGDDGSLALGGAGPLVSGGGAGGSGGSGGGGTYGGGGGGGGGQGNPADGGAGGGGGGGSDFVSPSVLSATVTEGVVHNDGSATISYQLPSPPPAPPAHGYWLVGSDGGVFSFGSAQFHGSMGGIPLQRPVVGIVPTKDLGGYWLDASDGGVFSFGDTQFYGSIPGLGIHPAGSGVPQSLDAPVVGMVPSRDQGGYFMVASDGGVFAFGDAHFAGSCPGIGGCSGAAVAVEPDASGNGYWVFTRTGNLYAFGDAPYLGAPGPQSSPVTSAVATPSGDGYWILDANGQVFAYGDASPLGSVTPGATGGFNPASAIFATSDGGGYWVADALGKVFTFGDAPNDGDMSGTRLNGPIIAASGS